MKRAGFLLLLPIALILSCGTAPAPEEPTPAEPAPVAEAAPPAAPVEPVPEPAPVPVEAEPVEVIEPEPAAETESFDPDTITEEKLTATKVDVQELITELNGIIRGRNYNAWITHLAAPYMEKISSKEFLDRITEELYERDKIVDSSLGKDPRRTQKKILRTARDYFNYMVVPSRSNVRMDEIDFLSENRVRAYALNNRTQRLEILYDLEMIDNEWKIIN